MGCKKRIEILFLCILAPLCAFTVLPAQADGEKNVDAAVDAFLHALEGVDEAQRTPEAVLAALNAKPAALPKTWAFAPVKSIAVDTSDGRNPIDTLLTPALQRAGLTFSPRADARTLIRRLYLDVLGLPPLPEEVEAFVADTRPEAYEELVDRVLASPHYGERWARHWLDLARYGETNGFETNTPRPNAWQYRDWVIEALNGDEPYDQFIREQIAGDALGADVATGFLVGGPRDEVKSPDIVLTKNQRDSELHDMVSTVGAAVLGLTVGCAKCHNHKFDPIAIQEYYQLRACLQGVNHGERESRPPDAAERLAKADALDVDARALRATLLRFAPLAATAPDAPVTRPMPSAVENVEHFAPITTKAVRITISATSDQSPCIDEIEIYSTGETPRNVGLATNGGVPSASSEYGPNEKHKTVHLNDGQFGNDHSWIPAEPKMGWAQIDFAQPETIDSMVWARDREGRFKDRLATHYVIEALDETGAWHAIAGSNDRIPFARDVKPTTDAAAKTGPCDCAPEAARADCAATVQKLAEIEAQAKSARSFQRLYAGYFTEPGPTKLQYRGDPMMEGQAVAPGGAEIVLAGFSLPEDTPEQSRRIKLAEWLTDPRNPLTPRVIVNRLWQHHFGRGIVETPGDFGAMGMRPTHPELLDWLAGELLRQDWHLKPLHRLMLLSEAYQQSSAPNADGLARDAEAKLLWRFPPRRLEAEPIRDSILATSGALDLRMGGPGYDVFKPDNSYVHIYVPKDTFDASDFRRMIYQFKPRMEQDITFGAFDCPDASQAEGKRNRSTTPLQALSLLNSPFMQQQADIFAARLTKESPADPIARAFALAFGRAPEADESERAQAFVAEEGLEAFCRALMNTSEFLYLN